MILKLKDDVGRWSSNEQEVGKIMSDYFGRIFSSSRPHNFDDALTRISVKVNDVANVRHTAEANAEEIRDALFRMHPNKTPEIDVMCFFLS